MFIPLTHLCRDVCHYCTFAQTPSKIETPFMDLEAVLDVAQSGAQLGCKEALFTLGEKPELRYRAAREWLAEHGYATTLEYLHDVAKAVFEQTGLLPHLNPGNMTPEEIDFLRPVSPSMGIMLESASERLTEKGMPHYGSPDKIPAVRLQTLADAGAAKVPFTTGILIGIGETRRERIESLLAIRKVHQHYGHIQEIIVQNFRAKPGTKMRAAPEPDLNELLWTIALARLIFGAEMSIQAPPNLSPGVLPQIVAAGIDDWGGVSPLTPDFVNPEAPWPHLDDLRRETAAAGKELHERLTIYPRFARDVNTWVDAGLRSAVLDKIDGEGLPRIDDWCPGDETAPPEEVLGRINAAPAKVSADVRVVLDRAEAGNDLSEADIVRLIRARGDDFNAIVQAADGLRRQTCGDTVSFVVNRNINYTNICYFKCQFCAFSKGKLSENLRGRPYDLSHEEIQRRTQEAWDRGGTEVCMQGGIHPEYTGATYVEIVKAVKQAVPDMHVHAFSPLEVWQGAATANLALPDYLLKLKRGRPRHSARHRGRDPRRRSPGRDLPRQNQHRAVACGDGSSAQRRLPHHGNHHVRPCGSTQALGATSHPGARPAETNRRVHRIRAVAVRAYGSAALPQGPSTAWSDVPRSDPGSRRRQAGTASAHHQHPGKLGEDGACGRRRRAQRGLQ